MARRRSIMSDDDRALAGRQRVMTPARGVPIEHPDMDADDLTPPPQAPPRLRAADPDLAAELDEWAITTWQHVASVARRTNNRVAAVHQGVIDQGQLADRIAAVERDAAEAKQVASVLRRALGWLGGMMSGGVVGAVLYVYAAGEKSGAARRDHAALVRDVDRNTNSIEKLRAAMEQHVAYHAAMTNKEHSK
jgi:hypothetical protein